MINLNFNKVDNLNSLESDDTRNQGLINPFQGSISGLVFNDVRIIDQLYAGSGKTTRGIKFYDGDAYLKTPFTISNPIKIYTDQVLEEMVTKPNVKVVTEEENLRKLGNTVILPVERVKEGQNAGIIENLQNNFKNQNNNQRLKSVFTYQEMQNMKKLSTPSPFDPEISTSIVPISECDPKMPTCDDIGSTTKPDENLPQATQRGQNPDGFLPIESRINDPESSQNLINSDSNNGTSLLLSKGWPSTITFTGAVILAAFVLFVIVYLIVKLSSDPKYNAKKQIPPSSDKRMRSSSVYCTSPDVGNTGIDTLKDLKSRRPLLEDSEAPPIPKKAVMPQMIVHNNRNQQKVQSVKNNNSLINMDSINPNNLLKKTQTLISSPSTKNSTPNFEEPLLTRQNPHAQSLQTHNNPHFQAHTMSRNGQSLAHNSNNNNRPHNISLVPKIEVTNTKQAGNQNRFLLTGSEEDTTSISDNSPLTTNFHQAQSNSYRSEKGSQNINQAISASNSSNRGSQFNNFINQGSYTMNSIRSSINQQVLPAGQNAFRKMEHTIGSSLNHFLESAGSNLR